MAGVKIGSLAVSIEADVKGFVDKLDKADKAVGKFTTTLDRRLLQPLLKSAAATAAAGVAMAAFANKVASVGEKMERTAKRLGLGVEQFSELRYAAARSGVEVQTLDMAMQRFTRRAAEAAAGTGEAKAALRELGVRLTDSSGKMRTADVLLGDVAEAFKGVTTQSDRVRLAFKLFDSEGVRMLDFLGRGKAGLEEMKKEAHALGAVWSEQATAEAIRFRENLARIEQVSEGLQRQMAGPLIEALNKVAEAFIEARKEGKGFLETLVESLRAPFRVPMLEQYEQQLGDVDEEIKKTKTRHQELLKIAMANPSSEAAWGLVTDAKTKLDELLVRYQKLEGMRNLELPGFFNPSAGEDNKPKPETGGKKPNPLGDFSDAQKKEMEDFFRGFTEENDAAWEREQAVREARRMAREQDLEDERKWVQDRIEMIDQVTEYEIEQGQKVMDEEEALRKARVEAGYKYNKLDWESTKTFLGNMSALMNTENKKMFEIGKAAAIAETVMNTYTAAVSAYKALAGIPIVGPALGAAAAAAAIAFGTAQVSAIRSTTMGTKSATPVAAANPTTGAPVGTPAGDVGGAGGSRQPDNFITFQGEGPISQRQLREFFERLNEGRRDGGGRFVVLSS